MLGVILMATELRGKMILFGDIIRLSGSLTSAVTPAGDDVIMQTMSCSS